MAEETDFQLDEAASTTSESAELVLELPDDTDAQIAMAETMGLDAQSAARKLAILPTASRNEALTSIHEEMKNQMDEILQANQEDVRAARASGMSEKLVARLDLAPHNKFQMMLQGIVDVRAMDDPIGVVDRAVMLDDGLVLKRSSCPIGVLFAIFEARPEVLTNITSLALKSGNAIILKGGSEASRTITALAKAIRKGLEHTAVSVKSVQVVVGDRKRAGPIVDRLLTLDKYIDLVIPRGGQDLVTYVKKQTQIAVLGHADGICIAYLRADCPKDVAVRVLYDSKVSYPAACNSVETLLVDTDALEEGQVFEPVARELLRAGVTLYCDERSKPAAERAFKQLVTDEQAEGNDISKFGQVLDAEPEHYRTEFLNLQLAVKAIVQSRGVPDDRTTDEAIQHINEHSSHHTDVILTKDENIAARFLGAVDSAGVYWNASTRMADGHRYGFGAEVGISTNKIHARGPVGLEGLTIYKWILCGQGHCAADYGPGLRKWKHTPIKPSNLDELPASFSNDIRRFLQ